MRRRLALLGLATTALVVIAFTIPLGLLVRRQAEDRARLEAERDARAVASLVALSAGLEFGQEEIGPALAPLPDGVVVSFPDGSMAGDLTAEQGRLIGEARERQASVADLVEGGWELAFPVVVRDGTIVVDAYVPDSDLREGVAVAWLLLASLGVVVIAVSVWVADRMGRALVEPIDQLAEAARRFGDGDREARVEASGPAEIRDVGEAFNRLAQRLDVLLAEERETAADLSHRLRTPLTSLRLRAESISRDVERQEMVAAVDRMEHAIDQLIHAARAGRDDTAASDLTAVVGARAVFWKVLAEDQSRAMRVDLPSEPVPVALGKDEVEAVVDALIGNVFAHTGAGTRLEVQVWLERAGPVLEIRDDGPGFGADDLLSRGSSGSGSTGLGLDIVRRTVESVGGHMRLNDRPGGGAVVTVRFG